MSYKILSKKYVVINNTKRELTTSETNTLLRSIELINSKNNCPMVYRCNNLTNLYSVLNEYSIEDISNKIFMLGEKAKNFYNDHDCLDNLCGKQRNYLLNMNDTSDETFKFIYNNIKDDNHHNDTDFKIFFQETSESKFLQIIQPIQNNDKLMIRDYYYAYLHTMDNVVKTYSHYVSTTLKYEEALKFGKDENKIIYHYILTESYYKFAIHSKNISENISELCKKYNLPAYKARYDSEDEISIKGGLLPHFIFGIEHIMANEEPEFIVNPHLFEKNFKIDDIITKGLLINQESFEDIIKTTKYNKYFSIFQQDDINEFNV
ncbi:MAG: hypothetical protein ACK5LP_10415 [Campylobacteraceae bacterium]